MIGGTGGIGETQEWATREMSRDGGWAMMAMSSG
jgi:hypothetical protein